MGECRLEQSREDVVGGCLVLVWVGYCRRHHRQQSRFWCEHQINRLVGDRRLVVGNQLHGWDGCRGGKGVRPNVDWVANVYSGRSCLGWWEW